MAAPRERPRTQSCDAPGASSGARGRGIAHPVNIVKVELSQAAWLVVVGICALAVLLLAINGYAGYAIVLGAVGASAAVNLI